MLRKIVQETGRFADLERTVCAALFGTHQINMVFGACEPDIEQAAFLSHFFRVFQGAAVWQKPLIQSNNKNLFKLQSFGGVQGHQRRRVQSVLPKCPGRKPTPDFPETLTGPFPDTHKRSGAAPERFPTG